MNVCTKVILLLLCVVVARDVGADAGWRHRRVLDRKYCNYIPSRFSPLKLNNIAGDGAARSLIWDSAAAI